MKRATIVFFISILVVSQENFATPSSELVYHDADSNRNWKIDVSEVFRMIALFNDNKFYTPDETTEDGYSPADVPPPDPSLVDPDQGSNEAFFATTIRGESDRSVEGMGTNWYDPIPHRIIEQRVINGRQVFQEIRCDSVVDSIFRAYQGACLNVLSIDPDVSDYELIDMELRSQQKVCGSKLVENRSIL